MKRGRDGFAVVLAAALLAAVVLLLVALTLLTRNELRVAAQRGAAEQARRNTLVGLRVALGRLQAAAGPDACSTAAAERFGAQNPRWTGVWTDGGGPVWLVSGAPGDANVTVTTTGAVANGTRLVGSNTSTADDGAVAALWEPIDAAGVAGLSGEQQVGRFAYWVGDEGVKGNVSVIDRVDEVPLPTGPAADDPVTSAEERARLRQLVAHRAGNDALDGSDGPTSGFRIGREDDAVAAVRWVQFGSALAVTQLRFQNLGTAQETENYRAFVRRHFHAFTVGSLGVLANAASGGLRRNFSELTAPEVPAAVQDLERFRPVAGRLPVTGGTAASGEPTAQIKPIVTEWALDFVPYREDGGARLFIGCRLRLELWNPFNLPLASTPSGVADFRVRIGGRRTGGVLGDTGLPVLQVSGPAGVAGEVDLRNLLGPAREIVVDLAGDVGAGQTVVVETGVETTWDCGLKLDDPTPGDGSDDVLRIAAGADAGRVLRLELFGAMASDGAAPLTVLDGFPSAAFARQCAPGGWSVPGDAPFAAGAQAVARLGVSYHWRLDPSRTTWAEWIDPAAPREAGPDLKGARIAYAETFWKSAGADPAASAAAVPAQFASGELFAVGGGFAACDFTVQRNLSIAALAQLSVPGERPFSVGNPWGGARNAVFDEAFFNPVAESWMPGQRLPHVRHRGLDGEGAAPSATELGGLGAARHLGVEGMFNVNSVSPVAWTVVLGRAVLGWSAADGTTADLENPFLVFAQSAPYAPAAARGVRCFSDESVQRLAQELTQRIAARPRPFRSLAEFVNSGVLQDSIDAAGLNSRADCLGDIGGVAPARFSANWLSQAAVLNTLAPVLAVRSDTFTIRVAAEALNPALEAGDPDRVAARAWCEAMVQRLPEYIDADEDAMAWPASLADNRALGRRFRIVAFRWLGPDDI